MKRVGKILVKKNVITFQNIEICFEKQRLRLLTEQRACEKKVLAVHSACEILNANVEKV